MLLFLIFVTILGVLYFLIENEIINVKKIDEYFKNKKR